MRKLFLGIVLLFFTFMAHAQEASPEVTPQAEDSLRLRPFTLEIGNISGVAPALWDELQAGTYIRDDGEVDNTYILHIAAQGAIFEDLIDPFLAVYELESLPESNEAYESELLSWAIYSFDFDPEGYELRVDIAIAEQEDFLYIVLMQSYRDENEALRSEVFFPSLDYFGLPLPEIQTALGYEVLSPVELESFGIESAYPLDWEEVNVGSYMRGADDFTTLIIQTSPDLGASEFAQLLLETLGLPTILPEEAERFESSLFEWAIYRIDFSQGVDLSLIIALTEDETRSYMVVLLCTTEEAQSLHERVLLPVLDVTMPLN